MTSLEYVKKVLQKYAVDQNKAVQYHRIFEPYIKEWANTLGLVDIKISGSSKKGTAVSSGTDVDLFISITSTNTDTLCDLYSSLFSYMTNKGFKARKQNVSIGIDYNTDQIDLVPARRQGQYGNDHSLYVSKKNSWTKTNIDTHISKVSSSNRTDEIKLTKIWRNSNNLDFPSFYLELVVIDALYNCQIGATDTNFLKVLNFIADSLQSKTYIDPANTNNCISDQISALEKSKIAIIARNSVNQSNWGNIVA